MHTVIYGALRTALFGALFNAASVQSWLITGAGLLIIGMGVLIISKSHKADYGQTAKISVNVIIGIVVIAMGAGGIAIINFGTDILRGFGIGA